jgi:hypothetical protein
MAVLPEKQTGRWHLQHVSHLLSTRRSGISQSVGLKLVEVLEKAVEAYKEKQGY